jgi:hypothetical protein
MTPSEARTAGEQLARRTRNAQGLPRRVRDREVARRVAQLLIQCETPGASRPGLATSERTYRNASYDDQTRVS